MSYSIKIIKYSKILVVVFMVIMSFSFSSLTLAQVKDPLGKSGLAQHIPDCTNLSNCQDVSVFLVVAIGIGRYLFSIIGALALIMFVYGGFTWITSRGSAEKVKKGMEIFGAAIIGLIISFSAYMLVSYFSEHIIQVDSKYTLKK